MRRFAIAVLAWVSAAAQGLPETERATAFERAVVQAMSDARTQPRAFARLLRAQRDLFEGTLWKRLERVPLRTEEGQAAVDEAIAFLETVRPVGPLRFNEGLALAARRHARDIGPRGSLDHAGADGSSLSARLNRLGTWHGVIAENIATYEEDPRDVVLQLIIDDGIPGRGHRNNLFNPSLHQAGAGAAPHRDYRTVIVVDCADGFLPHR